MEWMSFSEVRAMLGVSRATLSAWRADGRFPRFKRLPNGSLRIRRDTVEAWAEHLENV